VSSSGDKSESTDRIRAIDGLRAICLLLVLLYHCNFTFLPVQGGFLGVDLFFVISGLVISRGIWQKLEDKTFKISEFYKARIIRLYPGLFITLAFTTILAWFTMLPRELASYSKSLIATVGLFSNFYFWQNSNYFSPSVDYLPLIHTWSLGVEEQFYLFFPLAIILIFITRKYANPILWGSLAASVSIFILLVNDYPVITFYLLPFRIWEILVGVLLSRYIYKKKLSSTRNSRSADAIAGLSLTGILVITFRYQQVSINSAYIQLTTVALFSLILIFLPHTKYSQNILGNKIIQKIGALSYVAYLVHQPILVFFRLVNNGPISNWQKALAFLLTFVTAEAIWRFFEKPVRRWARSTDSKKRVPSMFIGGSIITLLLGLVISNSNFTFQNYTAEEKHLLSFTDPSYVISYEYGKCFLSGPFVGEDSYNGCFSKSSQGTGTFLFGDSHAAMVAVPLKASQENFSFLARSGCFALLPNKLMPPVCNSFFEYDLKKIKEQKPKQILLAGNWLEGSLGTSYGASILMKSLDATMKRINSISPESKIYLIGQTPEWSPNLPSVMVREKIPLQIGQRVNVENIEAFKEIDAQLEIVAQRNGATFINILNDLCDSSGCLAVVEKDGEIQPLVFDSNHLTQAGELRVSELIKSEIN
jgi:peptidoglycan/LPS O-acetylase OafA/YrhL